MSHPTRVDPFEPVVELAPKRRGNPAMVKGAPSLNPRGRPKVGTSLAEITRSTVEPTEVLEFLLTTMRDGKARLDVRVAAASQLLDRGWGRPLASHDVTVTSSVGAADHDDSALTLEDRRRLVAEYDALLAKRLAEQDAT